MTPTAEQGRLVCALLSRHYTKAQRTTIQHTLLDTILLCQRLFWTEVMTVDQAERVI